MNAVKEGKTEATDLEIILKRIGDGDRDSLADLYELVRESVFALSLSYLKNAEEAADVTQDTFVRIWENAFSYKARGTPMAWILTIARNLSLMRLRERKKRGDYSEEDWSAVPAEAPAVTVEDRMILQTALESLNDVERRVVLLHAVTGLRHREIADLLGQPISTVLSRYQRALRKMKTQMERGGSQ